MDIEFVVGDLLKLDVEAIVNPANSECEMGGGVARAIRKAGGKEIEEEAMNQAPVPIGRAIATSAGKLNFAYIFHAPTMRMPVQTTSAKNVSAAVLAALDLACDFGISSLGVPGMGTGTGRLSLEAAAAAMLEAVRRHKSAEGAIEKLVFVDTNEEMVASWKKVWRQQNAKEKEDEGAPA